MPTFDETRTGYGNLWRKATVRPECRADAKSVAERILRDKARYQGVESKTGVPWFWIACVHDRESGGDFRGVLHNGEHIIGTGRKTSDVPAGRGPFATWEEAAIDALTFDKVAAIRDWPIERCLYQFEAYNGWGYTNRGVNSPYVWAGTSLQEPGKFTSDNHFDPSATDTQLGCAAVLKLLAELDADVASRINTPTLAGVPSSGGEPPWMVKARGYIGFHETGTNRGIEEFIALAHTGSLGDPWCAIFANAMLEAVGVPGTRSAMARSFEHDAHFVRLDKPILGCIVTMWRGSPTSGSGHTGFFVKQDAQNVYLLDGNSSDEVGIHPHPAERITGNWWPISVPQSLEQAPIVHPDEPGVEILPPLKPGEPATPITTPTGTPLLLMLLLNLLEKRMTTPAQGGLDLSKLFGDFAKLLPILQDPILLRFINDQPVKRSELMTLPPEIFAALTGHAMPQLLLPQPAAAAPPPIAEQPVPAPITPAPPVAAPTKSILPGLAGGLSISGLIAALMGTGVMGTPFDMGQAPTTVGTLGSIVGALAPVIGAAGGFAPIVSIGLKLLGGLGNLVASKTKTT